MAEQYQVSGGTAAEISASIETGVVRGDWQFGAALPPVRVLATALHVSPATVAKAYQELRQRGVVETEGRRGTRVRSRPPVALSRSALRPPVPAGLLNLSSGEPDLSLLPPLGPALRVIADQVGPPQGYTSAATMPELIEAARPRLLAEGVPVAEAAIAVTAGALDSIERLLTAHLRPGDAVAVEDPGWANLMDLIAALGMRPLPVAVDPDGPEPGSLDAALRAGARAVVITVRAQNPTGAAVSAIRAAELRDLLSDHPDTLLIEDDHAAELAEAPPHCVGPVTRWWAFVRSASKPFGPDLRIAVLAGDETSIARVAGRMRIGMGWVSTVAQRLLLQLWRDPEVTELVAAAARSYGSRRRRLRHLLQARGVRSSGDTGINVWVPVPDETHAIAGLRDAGYAVAPGALFRIASPPGIRITVSPLAESDIEALADAVSTVVHPAATGLPMR
ncbi:GntR family transcriptional regulator [Actinoplanes sp. SE50]|uniref:aminotransferase class I/II-fold pyridoxal phosphate-dependent enzyme n=1 Tax=unclassified Actinoplanes TaxID=2626549 RepID=UPI00023EC534|nr:MULTISPECIES: aminotransferase class I/II-fold pyridoxal phosphate-dependent enzyme [unclassified Actinoplanes]AEV88055.1 GntR family transcriptional regulator [Actinoplanes sp. SE50/110]ATO86459.1 GntR family transcriptional regulator [Actinoplanes sp. SE50]SLM03874.1 GntR family transcriptional regulator [Actinoplanes sp. SE50/110]